VGLGDERCGQRVGFRAGHGDRDSVRLTVTLACGVAAYVLALALLQRWAREALKSPAQFVYYAAGTAGRGAVPLRRGRWRARFEEIIWPSQKQLKWSQLRVGLTVIFASLTLALLLFLMSGTGGYFSHRITLVSYFDNASGLRVGAPVRLSGVDIGNVIAIRVVPDKTNKLLLSKWS